MKYDHKRIEKKWQKEWADIGLYKTDTDPSKPKYYVLDMFPYPSGAGLHVGHPKGYIGSDIIARKRRMEGFRVLHPMGWDAFGLPAENYAIKTGTPPQKTTDESIATFKEQIAALSLSYDWDREIGSHRPDYYKWTQWLFTKFFEKGLVYKKKATVNWDPVDQTVLANEQVLADGTAERSGAKVEKKELEQWFYKITDYADELISGLDTVDWPESTKINQKNWIGRSEGAEIDFGLDLGQKYKFVILHGFKSAPDRPRWLWAKERLEEMGHEVILPRLPDPDAPTEDGWVSTALAATTYDEKTVLVGHSLGAVAALKVLEKLDHPIARLVTVGGFVSKNFKDNPRPFADTFDWKFDGEKICKNVGSITILHDPRDYAVSDAQARELSDVLKTPVTVGTSNEPHFTGDTEPDVVMWLRPTIRVFTTRPDTLFGATYLVLSPEHQWVKMALEHKTVLKNNDAVQRYVDEAKKKSDIERQSTDKEKTGVKLEGVEARNPATGEIIPLYVADYVLAQYGTGAIMAVPAHDERDYAFAKKFNIPVREVVEAVTERTSGPDAFRMNEPFDEREAIIAIVKHWSEDKYLCLSSPKRNLSYFICGGIEKEEDPVEAGKREIAEETGYESAEFLRALGSTIHSRFYQSIKKYNREAHFRPLLYQLRDGKRTEVDEREKELHDAIWIDADKVAAFLNRDDVSLAWTRVEGAATYAGEGRLVKSGEFDGLSTQEGRLALTQRFGRIKTTYKLRDWLISRQRYWGAPIPIVYDPAGNPHAIPEEHLPWLLPEDVEYLPKGTSPLGSSEELLERTERIFGKGWKPEIDTMDTFACSSWYFLRFADPKNDKEFASKKALEEWLPVDLYIGGAEHTVLHLMYARFFVKALRGMGYVSFDEPFLKLRHQGLILAEDGRKMSKRWGNVINPDDMVDLYGADSLRLYEMFMGPFDQQIAWNTNGVIGMRRFLERVWKLAEDLIDTPDKTIEANLNRTIKKVGADIEAFKFNTAISTMMIFVNAAEKSKLSRDQYARFLPLLAPFAPHIAEDLWHDIGKTESIHRAPWPSYDESQMQDEETTYAIQINGKTRGEVSIPAGASKDEAEALAKDAVKDRLAGEEIARTVVVPGRLVNFVLKA